MEKYLLLSSHRKQSRVVEESRLIMSSVRKRGDVVQSTHYYYCKIIILGKM